MTRAGVVWIVLVVSVYWMDFVLWCKAPDFSVCFVFFIIIFFWIQVLLPCFLLPAAAWNSTSATNWTTKTWQKWEKSKTKPSFGFIDVSSPRELLCVVNNPFNLTSPTHVLEVTPELDAASFWFHLRVLVCVLCEREDEAGWTWIPAGNRNRCFHRRQLQLCSALLC